MGQNIILYSTGCPKCNVLKDKLDSEHIKYLVCSDKQAMIQKGFVSVPMLEVDGVEMNFTTAMLWIKER